MKKILYAEDNFDTANVVKLILDNAGYQVEIVHTGKECLDKAIDDSWDLVMLDIVLPDMSAWEIFQSLKSRIHAKYAILSAIPASFERIIEIEKEGISDYITKPFTRSELLEKVAKVMAS